MIIITGKFELKLKICLKISQKIFLLKFNINMLQKIVQTKYFGKMDKIE